MSGEWAEQILNQSKSCWEKEIRRKSGPGTLRGGPDSWMAAFLALQLTSHYIRNMSGFISFLSSDSNTSREWGRGITSEKVGYITNSIVRMCRYSNKWIFPLSTTCSPLWARAVWLMLMISKSRQQHEGRTWLGSRLSFHYLTYQSLYY
jgi:hypothetical protein